MQDRFRATKTTGEGFASERLRLPHRGFQRDCHSCQGIGGSVQLDLTLQCSKSIFSFVEVDKPEYFYLYRISYAWYAAIGFFMTVTIGLIASLFAARTFKRCEGVEPHKKILERAVSGYRFHTCSMFYMRQLLRDRCGD